MAKKRILITEVSGECRNLRIDIDPFDDDPGYYCTAYPHGAGEKIDPKDCETCTREKHLIGENRRDLIERGAKALGRKHDPDNPSESEFEKIWAEEIIDPVKNSFRNAAETVLDAFLGKKE